MEEKQQNKICLKCSYYEKFYLKKLHAFEKTNQGKCTRKWETVDEAESCDGWQKAKYSFDRKRAATTALYQILNQLSAIKQIFEEDREEAKDLK